MAKSYTKSYKSSKAVLKAWVNNELSYADALGWLKYFYIHPEHAGTLLAK